MKLLTSAWLLLGALLFTFFGGTTPLLAQMATSYSPENQEAQIYVFGRDDCGFVRNYLPF